MVLAGTAMGGLYRSVDGGDSWDAVEAGLNPESSINDVLFDPTQADLVYLADGFSGVYRSPDGGESWEPLNQGLSTRAVNALALSDDGEHLYVATEGGGVFRLDLEGTRPPGATEPLVFTDVPGDSPYLLAIHGLYSRAVIAGYPGPAGTAFRPGEPVRRAQFAKMIVGAFGFPVDEGLESPFTDLGVDIVAPSPGVDNLYPHEYVAAAALAGVTKGVTATSFAPYQEITRAQVMTMVVRALREHGRRPLEDPPDSYGQWGNLAAFVDPTHGQNAHLAEWNGLLDGIDLQGWDVWSPAGRGEVAQMLWNAMTGFGLLED